MNSLFNKTLTIIPARGGSKGIKNKNLYPLLKKPLIFYSLDICEKLNIKPFISTDSKAILKACSGYGFSSDYLRPSSLAQDDSNIYDTIIDALKWLRNCDNMNYENILLLQPTNPIRKKEWIIDALKLFQEKKLSSLVSVSPMREHPLECIEINSSTFKWKYIKKHDKKFNGRQDYDSSNYFIDGSIYICSIKFLENERSLVKENITHPFIINQRYAIDIDTIEDLYVAEALLKLG